MQTIKGIFVIAAVIFLVIFGYRACKWLSPAPKLKPDGMNLFESEKALNDRYPFVKYVYVGHISQPFPNSTSRKDSQYFIKLSFKTDIPFHVFAKQFKKIKSADGVNKKSRESFQNLVKKTQASVKMRMPIVCIENATDKIEFTTDLITDFREDDSIINLIPFFDKTIVEFNIMDDHKFSITEIGIAMKGNSTTFSFDNDFKICKINSRTNTNSQGNITGELKRVDQYNQFDLTGYYHINFKLVSLGTSLMGETTYVNENQLYFTSRAFFKTSDNFRVGKFYIRGNSYDLIGFKDGDFYRLFAGNNHYIQMRKNLKTTSYLAPDFNNILSFQSNDGVSAGVFLTDFLKASLPPGKEEEMLTNFEKLGNAPATDKYNPESWTYYEAIEPHISNCEEVLLDDDLFNIFKESAWLKTYIQSNYSLNDVGYVWGVNYNPQKVREYILSRMSGTVSIKTPGKRIEKKKKKNNLSDIMGD